MKTYLSMLYKLKTIQSVIPYVKLISLILKHYSKKTNITLELQSLQLIPRVGTMKEIPMVMMTKVSYHINRNNGKEYKTTVAPKVLVQTVLKEMHDHFGHFGIGKTYSLIKRYYY